MKLNTSNPGKFEEFKRLFAAHGHTLEMTHIDLDEIDADPIKVVAHKASQMEEDVIVEDTSLEVEGADVGVNVRWLLEHLSQYEGKKAIWTTLLAFHKDGTVFIYQGQISGILVKPIHLGGYGFDSVFLPDGATETLAQAKPDHVNARAIAVDALIHHKAFAEHPVIKTWNGPWQTN
jgi:XTP/dITP diphosphohydrolase